MPAKNLYREAKEGIYSHIYNKGVENRIIFNNEQDYEVFQGFLKDYLTAPQDPESIKKSFTVKGRMFRGTPHQPKNYFNKVELIAYSLMPDHFHLILHQKTHGSLESFIRSLCTRYSMYFNKKHQHTGALFEGPYKSVQIADDPRLLYLTRYLHHAGGSSSYAQYLGEKVTSWVKPKAVQSFFDKVKTDLFKRADSYKTKDFTSYTYKNFVENYELNQKEKELIENIAFESENQHLERRVLARNVENNNAREIPNESSEKIHLDANLKPLQRLPEFLATTVVFLLLLTVGITNITTSTAKISNPSPAPAVLSETKKSETEKIERTEPKLMLIIKIDDDASASAIVNIRQKPTINSEKIGAAKNGDIFEFLSEDSKWYEVKLATQSGFISEEYIEVMEEINE